MYLLRTVRSQLGFGNRTKSSGLNFFWDVKLFGIRRLYIKFMIKGQLGQCVNHALDYGPVYQSGIETDSKLSGFSSAVFFQVHVIMSKRSKQQVVQIC